MIRQIGVLRSEHSSGVAVDVLGNTYISGTTGNNLGGPNQGLDDAFLIKFAVPEPSVGVLVAWGAMGVAARRRWYNIE